MSHTTSKYMPGTIERADDAIEPGHACTWIPPEHRTSTAPAAPHRSDDDNAPHQRHPTGATKRNWVLRTTREEVLEADAARHSLDEDLVLQAFAYTACEDSVFRDRVPYPMFRRRCLSLAMTSTDPPQIAYIPAFAVAQDCLKALAAGAVTDASGQVIVNTPSDDEIEPPSPETKEYIRKVCGIPDDAPDPWTTPGPPDPYTAGVAVERSAPFGTADWERRRRRIVAHPKVWHQQMMIWNTEPELSERFRRLADIDDDGTFILSVGAAKVCQSPSTAPAAPPDQTPSGSTAPAAPPEEPPSCSTAPAASPDQLPSGSTAPAAPPASSVPGIITYTPRPKQERTCGMCLETIDDRAANGKVHVNCRSLRDTMGEGQAKMHLQKRKAELAEANGAPSTKAVKHTAPAATDTAPVVRDIRAVPNAD